MPRHANYVPHGVIPAVLLPFENDLVDRRGEFPQASARRGRGRGPLRHHHQRAFDRSRLLHLRRAAPRARHRAGRDRRQAAARSTASGPTAVSKPRGSRAWRTQGGASALLVFPPAPFTLGQIAGDGAGAFQAHRGRHRPAADRVPVSAGDRAGLSEGHAAASCARRCRPSAPSRTGSATCRTTSGTSTLCKISRVR